MRNLLTLAAFGLTILCANASFGQTPDGETPAIEGVCDVLKGGMPGLYGLCVAYCEAQDLEPITDPTDPNIFKKMPNQRILANYEKRREATDPNMPCINAQPEPNCPCWTRKQLSELAMTAGTVYNETVDSYQISNVAAGGTNFAYVLTDGSQFWCQFLDRVPDPDVYSGPPLMISQEDSLICIADLMLEAENLP